MYIQDIQAIADEHSRQGECERVMEPSGPRDYMCGRAVARCLVMATLSRMRAASDMTMPVERHCMWWDIYEVVRR